MSHEFEAKVGERGQVVIPKPIRDLFDLRPGAIVGFSVEEGRIVIHANEDALIAFLEAIEKRPEPEAIDWDEQSADRFT